MKLFDVSLRDGLQSIKKIYTLSEKKDLYHKIVQKYKPTNIEIGSIVSSKILPQMNNSLELLKHTQKLGAKNIYMLTPNLNSVNLALQNNVNNFSLITSVSNEFQEKNINKSLNETKKELEGMYNLLNNSDVKNIKLYVSCITECPLTGNKDLKYICNELDYYIRNYENLTEICLSDTCGTLEFHNFKNIVDYMVLFYDSSILNKISLHLHKNKNMNETYNIINYAYHNGISRFDVSCLEKAGGCSVTMNSSNMKENLHYDDINSMLFNK